MKYYTVLALVVIGAGATLHLTQAQAAARKRDISPVKDQPGLYKSSQPLQFKKGEVFGCDQAPAADRVSTLETYGSKEHEALDRKELAAAADARGQQIAARQTREQAIVAAAKRKEEDRRRAIEAKAKAEAEAKARREIDDEVARLEQLRASAEAETDPEKKKEIEDQVKKAEKAMSGLAAKFRSLFGKG